MNSDEIKENLLALSDDALDDTMKPLIKKWSSPATSLEVLEVLDECIYASLTTGIVVTVLQCLYDDALKVEARSHGDNLPLATWRVGK